MNPEHLFAGTNADNQEDAVTKGSKIRVRIPDARLEALAVGQTSIRALAKETGCSPSAVHRERARYRLVRIDRMVAADNAELSRKWLLA